jgi:hypothetical protein
MPSAALEALILARLLSAVQAAGGQYGGYNPAVETRVTVKKKVGSSLPFLVAGILALLAGAFLFLMAATKVRRSLVQGSMKMLESD